MGEIPAGAGRVVVSHQPSRLSTAALVNDADPVGRQGGGMTRLTPREAEVVHLLADGMSTREISRKLTLTEHTIRNYLSAIYDKLGVSSRVELALYAVAREDFTRPMGE